MDLVTGATGLVGSHVMLELLTRHRAVRALARAGSDREKLLRLFRHYRPDGDELFARIEWVEGDLLDLAVLQDALQGIHHVHHCAAMVSFDPRDSRRLLAVNIGGTANVVNAALEAGAKGLVHVSSTGACSDATGGRPVDERDRFVNDRSTSAYAVSKYEGELEVQRGVAEGLRAVIVNPCVVIGPGDDARSSMAIMGRLKRGTRFFPPGSTSFVDVRDVAWAMAELIDRGQNGERYILSGPVLSYQEFFTRITTGLGVPAPTLPAPAWALEAAWRLDRLRTLFGGRSLITRHTVRSAVHHRAYSSAKVQAALDMRFRDAGEMIGNAVRFARS
jgi:nucleoside-diphosphate-sugar epimerase